MKNLNNKLIKLFSLLILLTIILLIKDKIIGLLASKKIIQPFLTVGKNEFSQFDIVSSSQETAIYKKSGPWFVKKNTSDFKADEERVNKIINSILAFKKEELVSNNKNKHQEFGINNQQLIKFKVNNKNFSLYIGKTAGITKNYIRLNNENTVYTAEGFTDVFYPDDYRDLSVYFVNDENKITAVTIDFAGKKTILDKKNNDWFLNGKKLAREKVDFFLNDLKTLKATDILKSDKISSDLVVSDLTISVIENNQERKADFFTQDKDKYFLRTSNSNDIFEIASDYVEPLKKEEKDFS